MDLTDKIALVTGASRGIGSAIAQSLAASGATVAVNYRGSHESAGVAVNCIEAAGGQAKAFQADVSSSEQANQLIQAVISELGGLHVVVNNAGITRDGLLVRMSDTDWDDVIATNLTGTFNVIRASARHLMKQREGSIVNVTSVVGLTGNSGQANYASAKAGVVGLTKSVARELASRGIRVNAVAPGFIETDMTAKLPLSLRDEVLKNIAMATFGDPQDVADAVVFLASPQARYITGQILAVDGGMTFI